MLARALRIPLRGSVSAADAGLLLRSDERPFVLSGDWAGGAALLGSEPVTIAPIRGLHPATLRSRDPRFGVGARVVAS